MPISSQVPIIGYVANGVTKSFAFPFAILSADDLKVKVGADVVTTGFSIAGVGDRDGGSVTFTDAPASLTPIILYREVTLDRTTDYQENGDLLAIVLDDDLDRIWMALQDQLLLSDRALRSPLGETLQQLPPASERALMALAFDAAGNPIVVRGTNDGGSALALDLMDTAPGKGAALVGYGDGTVADALDALAGASSSAIDIRTYGAVLDGVTNDAAALLAANAAAVAAKLPLLIPGVAHIGTATTITAPLVDGLHQMFSTTSQVTISNGLPVRPEWWGIGNQNAVDLAIQSLPATGGTVQLELATYKPNGYAYGFGGLGTGKYMSKDNVTIQGRKMPRISSDCRSLTGGSIIQGMFLAYANGFTLCDVGIDCGKTVLDTYYGGVAAAGVTEGCTFTFPDSATKAGATLANMKRNVSYHNVVGLCSAPDAPVHALLLGEGCDTVTTSGDMVACYGVHGIVFKCSNVRAGALTAYLNNSDSLIIKSDAQASAVARDIQIDSVSMDGSGPYGSSPYVAATPTRALILEAAAGGLDKVQIGKVKITSGYTSGLYPVFGGTGFQIESVQIGSLEYDGFGAVGASYGIDIIAAANQPIKSWSVANVEARNCTAAVHADWAQDANLRNRVNVGALFASTCTYAVDIGSQSYLSIGEVHTANMSDAVYRITGTPKMSVGQLFKDEATPAFYSATAGGLVPTVAAGWTQVNGNDPFGIDQIGGRVGLRGLIKPTSAGSTNIFATLPVWARPMTVKRFVAQGYNGTTTTAVPVAVSPDGNVLVNEVAGGVANVFGTGSWLSLSGISWDQQA